MPTVDNNVYIDSSFLTEVAGGEDVAHELSFVLPDNIGEYEIPIIYQAVNGEPTIIDRDIVYTAGSLASGIENVLVSFFEAHTDTAALVSLVNYSVPDTIISGSINKDVDYATGHAPVHGAFNRHINYIAGDRYGWANSKLVTYQFFTIISGANDYWVNHMNFSGHTDPDGYPIPSLGYYGSTIVEYGGTVSGSGTFITDIDITFAGWVEFPIDVDVWAVDEGLTSVYETEIITVGAGLPKFYTDVYSADPTFSDIDCDIYCSLLDMGIIYTDITTINGGLPTIDCDIHSVVMATSMLSCDIDLFSLKITNFSLDVGEHTTAAGIISVDILDDVYSITVSGTYLEVEGQRLPVTFSGIEDGYRMFYDPVDDFEFLSGPTIFTVRAENNNGDILRKDYYLTFGYIVQYDNYPRFGRDFNYSTKVTVRVSAEDYSSCPTLSVDAYRFITENRKNVDLGASITGMFQASEDSNLSVAIYPQSTAYFYDKEFTVVIHAKDFAGNVMKPVLLQYKIEDKPD